MPVVPTPPTITDGIVPSSTWNQFRDVLRWLQAKPIAQLRQTSSHNLNNATVTPIQLQTEVVDDDIDGVGGHDNVTNNTRWTCRYPGWHLLSGMTTFVANATGIRWCGLRVNGVDLFGSFVSLPATATDVNGIPCNTMRAYLDINDYVELVAYQTSGGLLATYAASAQWQSGLAVGWERR